MPPVKAPAFDQIRDSGPIVKGLFAISMVLGVAGFAMVGYGFLQPPPGTPAGDLAPISKAGFIVFGVALALQIFCAIGIALGGGRRR